MKIKNISIIILFLILNLFLTNKVFAEVFFSPSKDSVGIGEQFYVDLMLNPETESVNAISGDISYQGDDVSLLRIEDGKSMVNLWVEKPKIKGNIISFAGIMSSSFSGVIDPFNPEVRLPGLIIRLVFEAKKQGQINFSASNFSLNKNDGLGSEMRIQDAKGSVIVGNYINKTKYENSEDNDPQLEAYITRDPNIFNNKYVLIFKATDKETGIKSVMIKEGRKDWKEIESPYLLIDQSRHSGITLQAMNYSGAGIIVNINKVPYDWKFIVERLILIIFGLSILFLIVRRIYVKNK